MTVNARQHVILLRIAGIIRFDWQERVDEVLMAGDAGILRNDLVARFDLDRVVVVLQREGDRVE